jgi:GcrA cell cycle regulator
MRLGERGAMRAGGRRKSCARGLAALAERRLRAAFALSATQPVAGIYEAIMIATWTQERVEQLRTHIHAGLTCSQIADEIGVTRNAVIGKIHRLGLGPGRSVATARPPDSGVPRTRLRRITQRQQLRAAFGQASESAAAAVALVLVESPQRCSLLDLTQGRCRWPINDPGHADFAFCGNASVAGFSYCTGHARMAYRLTPRRA